MISYERIEQANLSAAKFLQLWAYIDHQDMWYELLSRGRHNFYEYSWLRDLVESEISFKEVMRALLAHSLIESHERIESYSIHPVIHDWCTESVGRGQVDSTSLAFTIVGSAVPSESEPEYWLTQQRLLPHADRCVRYLQELDTPDGIGYSGSNDSFHNLGFLYDNQGKMVEAEKMYQRALEGKEKAWGPEHTSTLDTVNNFGNLYKDRGKLGEAEEMYQRTSKGYEKAFGIEHPMALNAAYLLGCVYQETLKLESAEHFFRRATIGYTCSLGTEHSSTQDASRRLSYIRTLRLHSKETTFTISDSELSSANSYLEDTSQLPSSVSSVSAALRQAKIEESILGVARLFQKDDDIRVTVWKALERSKDELKFDRPRLERHFTRLIRRYSNELNQNSGASMERDTANFVRNNS